jgi:hypothetical protein
VNGNLIPTHALPGGFVDMSHDPDDGIINDSLGTFSFADSCGLDDEMETGDAKYYNLNPRED